MRAENRKRIGAAVAVVSVSAALLVTAPGTGSAAPSSAPAAAAEPEAVPSLRAYGITGDGTLMATFTTDRPTVLDWVRAVTGLSGDQKLVGIDYRPQDGLMYGVGDKGGIYTIKTPPATSDVVVTKVSQLQVALYGTNFDIDFNPAADRLRLLSDNGQNLRHNLHDDTTIEDATLTTPPATGPARGVTAAAYTNNDLNAATVTSLFNVNTTTDQVVIQAPANNGTLSPTGSLGFDAGANAGLDIFSTLANGKTKDNTAFASLTPYGASTPSLYTVNLLTGEPTAVGQFPLNITDLALTLTGS
ncbi:DUF4394 domain-containing protein [Streptomyces aurantiacus]|uniref:DUF4394 domain-containing protein n=1 Tax=Streptomyces aurantiacus TaxID=47760 RepID=UPI0003F6607C|nr:DUF4394 domain-containing protein [Streptomyces aurantiacus]